MSAFRHEALIYDSDEDFLAAAAPFVRAGLAAGEPTLVGIDADRQALLREALDDGAGMTVVDQEHYGRPFTTLRANDRLLRGYAEAGAPRVRIMGEIPPTGLAAAWHGWVRYEAAINHLWADLPVWAVCCYDTRATPDAVLSDVAQTHRQLTDRRHSPNHRFAHPATFLAEQARREVDPLEAGAPAIELLDPMPADARHALRDLTTGLTAGQRDDLELAVTEVVTNAIRHGRRPVVLRAWVAPQRVVVTVRDAGPGPGDPFAGFLPAGDDEREGGLGLWVTYQSCSRVTLTTGPNGFTVRLVAGEPHAGGPAGPASTLTA